VEVLLFSHARFGTSLENDLFTEVIGIHVLLTTAC
jgi:hypothetical protein